MAVRRWLRRRKDEHCNRTLVQFWRCYQDTPYLLWLIIKFNNGKNCEFHVVRIQAFSPVNLLQAKAKPVKRLRHTSPFFRHNTSTPHLRHPKWIETTIYKSHARQFHPSDSILPTTHASSPRHDFARSLASSHRIPPSTVIRSSMMTAR
jgi:hypothetical protein